MGFHFFHDFTFGWVGVDLFFVLSGFLITGKLVESIGQRRYFFSFYIRRILRIVPLYYFVLIIFFVLLPVFASSYVSESMQQLIKDQFYYWTFSINFIEAKDGWPANITLIHFWSLACEMQFYLVWPFVIILVKNDIKKRMLLWVFIILAIVFRIYFTEYFSLHLVSRYVLLFSRIDAFAIGGLAYYYLSSPAGPAKRMPPLALSGFSLAIILFLSFRYKLNWHYTNEPVQWIGYTLNAFFWGGILMFYCATNMKSNVISGLFARIGKYSYAMYVFHLPLWIFLEKFFETHRPSFPHWLLGISAFIITFLLAWLSYHLYEKYFLRMKPALQHA
jgi:peptidoglycan/LPS O-acetylase OafA/YrhL